MKATIAYFQWGPIGCSSRVQRGWGTPNPGKNIWKMIFFQGQGKVREYCGWPGKFRKHLESQGKVREFEK